MRDKPSERARKGESTGSDDPTAETTARGYYGLPVLKTPVWRWEIWAYFFCGGLAAGSYAVASLAMLVGDRRDRPVSRVGYVLSFLAVLACPPLLIKDLGRPERFLTMLRVLKPHSPMSLGVWAILGFSGCAAAMAFRAILGESPARLGRLARLVPVHPLAIGGTGVACFLGGYTGVLLSVTSVPLWSRSRWLGPAFLASAFSAGVSAISGSLVLLRQTEPATRQKLETLETVARFGEAVALVGFLRETSWAAKPILDLEQSGRPFELGAVGLGIVVPLVANVAGFARHSPVRLALAICGLLGSLFLRYALVEGGRASADDPTATFRHTDVPEDKAVR
jgi:formate-dependent nitrite reductase membrane component NrfD